MCIKTNWMCSSIANLDNDVCWVISSLPSSGGSRILQGGNYRQKTLFEAYPRYLNPFFRSSHPIPRCWTSRNQFRLRHQFHSIPELISSGIERNRTELPGIPCRCNSGIARVSRTYICRHNTTSEGEGGIPESNGIARDCTELHGIPESEVLLSFYYLWQI